MSTAAHSLPRKRSHAKQWRTFARARSTANSPREMGTPKLVGCPRPSRTLSDRYHPPA